MLRDRTPARQPDLIFVVLDTVRADHTGLCGYERPTTPVLEELRDAGWAWTCRAVTPGPWTLPSHASFFTGLDVVELRSRVDLPTDRDTLAGQLAERGYHTVMLSANMVLAKPDFLGAGFRERHLPKVFNKWKGAALGKKLESILAEVSEDEPLFLYVNILDAHAPYPAIPKGVGWVEPQGPVQHRMFSRNKDNPFNRFVAGEMSDDEASAYSGRLRNGYDFGIHHADKSLGRVLALLQEHGRMDNYRIVVTSDHGEFLGEHQQIGHGATLYEPVVRVPFLYFDSSKAGKMALPEPFPALAAFHLIRDGALPAEPMLPTSVTYESPGRRTTWNGVAIWDQDNNKLLWRDGAYELFRLSEDPGERHPADAADHPLISTLESVVDRNAEIIERGPDVDTPTLELLRRVGYIE